MPETLRRRRGLRFGIADMDHLIQCDDDGARSAERYQRPAHAAHSAASRLGHPAGCAKLALRWQGSGASLAQGALA